LFNETVTELCEEEDAALFQKKAAIIAQSLEFGLAHYNGVLLQNGERFVKYPHYQEKL